jgi:predicted dehydrogenase
MLNFVQLKNLKDFEILKIRQFENAERDRPDFQNKYLKMLYFFFREGFISTFRKYSAHRSQQKRYLTFIFIRAHESEYINISIQFSDAPSQFVVVNKFYPSVEIDFNEVAKQVDYYFTEFNQFAEMSNYEVLGIKTSAPLILEEAPPVYNDSYENGLIMFGLGGYVKMFVLQHFKRIKKICCVDYKAPVMEEIKKQYGFQYGCISAVSALPVISHVKKPVVIIATFHSDHASLARMVYEENNNSVIFIEKPPTVTLDDLKDLIHLYNHGASIEIGFNRRFIGFNKYIREKVKNQIVYVTCSVKEVIISNNHWYLWKNQGTRITGNAVHWFDLANYWIDSIPVEINLLSNPTDCDSAAISVLYKNGSVLNITVTDKGNSMRGVQEKIEVRFGNETIFVNDYLTLEHIKQNGVLIKKLRFIRDKGHKAMYRNFKKITKYQCKSEYTVVDLIRTSLITYYASEMLKNNVRNMNIENEVNGFLKLANH